MQCCPAVGPDVVVTNGVAVGIVATKVREKNLSICFMAAVGSDVVVDIGAVVRELVKPINM